MCLVLALDERRAQCSNKSSAESVQLIEGGVCAVGGISGCACELRHEPLLGLVKVVSTVAHACYIDDMGCGRIIDGNLCPPPGPSGPRRGLSE